MHKSKLALAIAFAFTLAACGTQTQTNLPAGVTLVDFSPNRSKAFIFLIKSISWTMV